MKKIFSKKWKASKQPRKQRKYVAKAPLHTKRKFLSANLSKNLRKKYSKRSFKLRKGDTVKVMKGSFKKKQGKISSIDVKRTKIAIEGIQKSKKDGTKVNIFFHPSNLQIQELNLEDTKRTKRINWEEVKEKEEKKTKDKNKKPDKKEKPKEKK